MLSVNAGKKYGKLIDFLEKRSVANCFKASGSIVDIKSIGQKLPVVHLIVNIMIMRNVVVGVSTNRNVYL